MCGPWLDHPCSWVDNAHLAQQRIAEAMRAIADADGAVLVHCAGGRDRTGMICAMLLDLAGATDQAIADDYADGWLGAGAYAGHGWAYDPHRATWTEHHEPAPSPAELEQQLTDRLPAIEQWRSSFDTRAFLQSAGLTPAEVGRLAAMLNGG